MKKLEQMHHQRDQMVAHQLVHDITIDNQREAALQDYIHQLSELLVEKNLRYSHVKDEFREIARVRTLTILPRLDPERKRSVLQFLYESGLLGKGEPIVQLQEANLSRADLSGAIFNDVNLLGANLKGADLSNANLSNANLKGALLIEADLKGADLYSANLSEAILTNSIGIDDTKLETEAKSLKGAILPDGSKHP